MQIYYYNNIDQIPLIKPDNTYISIRLKSDNLNFYDTDKFIDSSKPVNSSGISFQKSLSFSNFTKSLSQGIITSFFVKLLKFKQNKHETVVQEYIQKPVNEVASQVCKDVGILINFEKNALLDEIQKLKTGINGIVRPESELSAHDIENMINSDLNIITSKDIESIIDTFDSKDQKLVSIILNRLTQFSNMQSFNELNKILEKEGVNNNFILLRTERPSLADNHIYVVNKWHDFDRCHHNRRIDELKHYNEKGLSLFDDEILYLLESNLDFRRDFNRYVGKILYPEGWLNGINLFNHTENLAEKVSDVLKNVKNNTNMSDQDIDKALNNAINSQVLNKINKLKLSGILNPDIEFKIIQNEERVKLEPNSENIANNLAVDKISTNELNEIILSFPGQYRQLILEMLAHDMKVFSLRMLSERLYNLHGKICPDGNLDGVYFFVADPLKSFNFVMNIYKTINKIPSSHIITSSINIPNNAKKVVIIDDISASGQGLIHACSELSIKGYNIELVPLIATDKAINKLFERYQHKNISIIPGEVIKPFRETDYFSALPDEIKELYSRLLQTFGFDRQGLNVAFPYMSPDNNNAFFNNFIAKYFTLNGGGVKNYENKYNKDLFIY